jgi:hypothetical protein
MASFIELVSFNLEKLLRKWEYDPAARADASLLRAVYNQLQRLELDNFAHTFYGRLNLGLGWALELWRYWERFWLGRHTKLNH